MKDRLEVPLTPSECREVQEKLLELLSCQVRWYTMGESASVPAELAQRLLDSICCCLGISSRHPDERWKRLLNCDVTAAYQSGLSCIEKKTRLGERLWQAVCANLPPVENTSMLDTLKSIGTFWRKYDSAFFAHEIPCDIDYQLAIPVPGSFQGIDYVDQYLENFFVKTVSFGNIRPGTWRRSLIDIARTTGAC